MLFHSLPWQPLSKWMNTFPTWKDIILSPIKFVLQHTAKAEWIINFFFLCLCQPNLIFSPQNFDAEYMAMVVFILFPYIIFCLLLAITSVQFLFELCFLIVSGLDIYTILYFFFISPNRMMTVHRWEWSIQEKKKKIWKKSCLLARPYLMRMESSC